jgi:fucokinase
VLGEHLDSGALALLQQSYCNNWLKHIASLRDTKSQQPHWEVCVLTASNDRQAEAYEAQLEARRESGLLPSETQFEVVADPDGLRIGSGGATLRVLSHLASKLPPHHTDFGDPFAGRRVLVIHSGGDSRRLPHCSAVGKLFARVPHELPDGRPSSLFDELLVSFSGLPRQVPAGILVASGDTLLLFDHSQLAFTSFGVAGVGVATPAERGTHHGVYVTEGSSHRVCGFLHKPSIGRMRMEGA